MIIVALAVVGATALGIASERRVAAALTIARRSLGLMLYVLVPFVSFVNIAHLRFTESRGVGLGFAYIAVITVGLTAWTAGRWALGLSGSRLGALICAVVVSNTGYLGYPVAVALFGAGALPSAVAYDQLVNGPATFLIAFGVGAALGTAATNARARAWSFISRNPPLIAVIAGLIAPPTLAPAPLPAISHVIVDGMLVVGFFAVGVYLSSERRVDGAPLIAGPDRPVMLAVGLRMALAPLIMVALSGLLVGVPSTYLLQSAMPTGISSLIVGHSYGLDQELIATIIVWSTAIALIAALVLAAVT